MPSLTASRIRMAESGKGKRHTWLAPGWTRLARINPIERHIVTVLVTNCIIVNDQARPVRAAFDFQLQMLIQCFAHRDDDSIGATAYDRIDHLVLI